MRFKFVIAALIAFVFLTGSAAAIYLNYWFEPSQGQLSAEGLGELVPGETRILEVAETTQGVTFQLVTYRTTSDVCFDVTAETKDGPQGATGGCGFGVSTLGSRELEATNHGTLSLEQGSFSTVIGRAGSQVQKVRVLYGDDTSDIRSVHTDMRVWFAVRSPGRNVVRWEPAD